MNVLNGGSFTKRYTITWHHSKYGMQSFNVDYFANPQVNNSISFNSALLRQHKSIGLFVKNYRVKYMKVPTIDTTRCNKIHKNIHKAETQLIQKTNVHQRTSTNETSISCKQRFQQISLII